MIPKMWKVGLALLTFSSSALCASLLCPKDATCKQYGHIESNSLDFLNNMPPEQYPKITHLSLSQASLEKLKTKLKVLTNLEYLNLSHNNLKVSSLPSLPNLKGLKMTNNNLKDFKFSDLPKNIEEIDLSDNLLTQIPTDWETLKSLKSLVISKNPIDCQCLNVLTIMKIRDSDIKISEPVICHSPKEFEGKDISLTNCSINDLMMYDEPEVEGSGSTDIFESNTRETIPHLTEEENNTFEENTIVDDKISEVVSTNILRSDNGEQLINANHLNTLEEEEGSGFEGSGFIDLQIPIISACHINCSTPNPIGIHDEQDASELPNPGVQIQIVAEDILHGLKGNQPQTTTLSSTAASITAKESLLIQVSEIPINKEGNINLKISDKENDKEISSHETKIAEKMEKAFLNENSYAVYVVVAVGILLAAVFLVCLIKNRKNKNRRGRPQGYGEEMKPLGKPIIQAVNEKNGKHIHIPENASLINGNGKAKDGPVLTAFTPLVHPEILPTEDEDEEPELRCKQELLTPTTERVTIRASEIPDSIPKTPLLVDRKKNSVGEIVSTVLPP